MPQFRIRCIVIRMRLKKKKKRSKSLNIKRKKKHLIKINTKFNKINIKFNLKKIINKLNKRPIMKFRRIKVRFK